MLTAEQSLPSPPTKRYQILETPDWARPVKQPPYPPLTPKTQAQKRGIRYERKVSWRLLELYELSYIPALWFMYHSRGRIRYCQFDGLLVLAERKVLAIVECKYQHTADAYWQLSNVYVPVLRSFLGRGNPYSIATCEVVKWFDPS